MRASTPFSGSECHPPFHEECLKHHGHKGDPGVTLGSCDTVGERAQVILVWARALGVGNVDFIKLNNTSIEGVS